MTNASPPQKAKSHKFVSHLEVAQISFLLLHGRKERAFRVSFLKAVRRTLRTAMTQYALDDRVGQFIYSSN